MNATIRPRLVVTNVDNAVTYYEKCLGAERGPRYAEDSGHVVHAEIRIGDSSISLTQSRDEWSLHAPEKLGGSPLLLTVTVEDSSAVGAAMVADGGTVIIPSRTAPTENGKVVCGTRSATCGSSARTSPTNEPGIACRSRGCVTCSGSWRFWERHVGRRLARHCPLASRCTLPLASPVGQMQ